MEPRIGTRTRRRRAFACQPCRQKKLRCDHQQPCRNCSRSKDPNIVCLYVDGPPSAPATAALGDRSGRPLDRNGSVDASDRDPEVAATPKSDTPLSIRQQRAAGQRWHSAALGSVLVDTTPGSSPSIPQSTGPDTSQDIQPALGRVVGELTDPIRAFMIRTRYISPSSWMYSILLVPQSLTWLEPIRQGKGASWEIVSACKALSKRLRDHQVLQWAYGEYGKFLPYRAMSDVLIDNYLRTYETVYRILHVPTFRADYDRLWQRNDIHGNSNSHALNGFVVQVQLCCALGALLYDESFSLRAQALQWTREAGAWIDTPAKTLLDLPNVQNMCLHLLAYESLQGPWGDKAWVLSGTLTRAAMLVGLHRDPTKLPGISRGHAEVRRRLWWTVLELTLGSCLDPGAAPLLSLDDCDSALPSNFDDSQLDPSQEAGNGESRSPLIPKSMDQYTDTSLQIILGQTLPARLAVARLATSLKPNDYDEVLKLHERYGTACRQLSASLRALGSCLSEFQRQFCETVMARYTFTLHVPYMVVGFKNPAAYMLSRKACVDAAVSLLYSCFSPSSMEKEPLLTAIRQTMDRLDSSGAGVVSGQRGDFARLCITSSGPCRSAPFQALMIIAGELNALVDENRSSIRPSGDTRTLELLSLLRVARDWTRQRIRAGHESNRDHVCISLALTSIESAMKGGESDAEEAVMMRGKEACLEEKAILEELIPVSDARWDGAATTEELSSPEYDLLAEDDMWLMQATDFVDFDFMSV